MAELTAAETPIISSPLGRSRATAEIMRECGGFTAEIARDSRIAEVSMGSWDGLTKAEVAALDPGLMEAPPPDWFMRSPDGESYDAFASRLGDWLDEFRHTTRP